MFSGHIKLTTEVYSTDHISISIVKVLVLGEVKEVSRVAQPGNDEHHDDERHDDERALSGGN
jgi:hypothetical protein